MAHNPDDPFCDCPDCLKGLEEAGLLAEKKPDVLEQAAFWLEIRLTDLKERGMTGHDKQVECYAALAQVRQALALERIEALLRNGIPIERV